ncbi:hypothetical protein HTVC111P_gp45 [Pelagibacter phage HTVC111P]|nr:hypothetical protein HTVC111P_gp45 [Pelagibacter phage HTVC111P]
MLIFKFCAIIFYISLLLLMIDWFYTDLVLFSSMLTKDYNVLLAYQELVEL